MPFFKHALTSKFPDTFLISDTNPHKNVYEVNWK